MVDAGVQGLSQVQRGPPGEQPQPSPGPRVDAATQERGEQLGGRRLGHGREIDPLGQPFLPQGHHGVGTGLTGPDRHDHARRRVGGDVQDQGRGSVVEQVGVVDPHHGGGVAVQQGTGGDPQHVESIGGDETLQVGRPRREGPERDRGGRSGRPHQDRPRPPAGHPLEGLHEHTGLPDPGRAHHHRSAFAPQCGVHQVQLVVPADERPVRPVTIRHATTPP